MACYTTYCGYLSQMDTPSVKNAAQISVLTRRIPSSSCGSSGPRAVSFRRWTDDTVLFHEIDQASSPAVANSQAALQRGSGSAACVANHANRVLVKIIVNVLATLDIAVGRTFRLAVLVLRRRQQLLLVFRLGLLAPEVAHGSDFFFRHQRPVNAMKPRRPGRQIQHVASSKQRFRAVRIENGARIHLAGNAERNASREVRLDQAGDHVHGGPLRRKD